VIRTAINIKAKNTIANLNDLLIIPPLYIKVYAYLVNSAKSKLQLPKRVKVWFNRHTLTFIFIALGTVFISVAIPQFNAAISPIENQSTTIHWVMGGIFMFIGLLAFFIAYMRLRKEDRAREQRETKRMEIEEARENRDIARFEQEKLLHTNVQIITPTPEERNSKSTQQDDVLRS